jgi:hypothetical protein
VTPPCSPGTVEKLAAIASPASRDGDDDDLVRRAATGALGRCRALTVLEHLLTDDRGSTQTRGDAAVVLVRYGENHGAEAVAELLTRDPDPALALRLIAALGRAQPTSSVARGLCAATSQPPRVAHAARAQLASLFPGLDPC